MTALSEFKKGGTSQFRREHVLATISSLCKEQICSQGLLSESIWKKVTNSVGSFAIVRPELER
jgi:hypothetical protein